MTRLIGRPLLAPPPRLTGPWSSRVIQTLLVLKRAGLDFEDSWRFALEQHPPRGRDLGEQRPTLFAEGAEGELSPVEFLRVSAEDAWHGRRPILTHLVIPDRAPERAESRFVA